MFLNAALALIEKDSEQRRGASNYLGGTQLSKEYAPEVVKMGILRKGKGNIKTSSHRSSTKQPKWTPKQVVLCPGRFTYYNLKNQKQSIGNLFGGSSGHNSNHTDELSPSQFSFSNGKELGNIKKNYSKKLKKKKKKKISHIHFDFFFDTLF